MCFSNPPAAHRANLLITWECHSSCYHSGLYVLIYNVLKIASLHFEKSRIPIVYSSLFYDLCLLSNEPRLWAAVSLAHTTLCPRQGAPQESPLTEPVLLTVLQFYAACKSPACVTLYLTANYFLKMEDK